VINGTNGANDGPPVPVRESHQLVLEPADATGQFEIQPADASAETITGALSGTSNIALFPDDRVKVTAQSPSPFFGALEKTYTIAELEELEWKLALPARSREEVLADVDRLLAAGQETEAEELYTKAAGFEPGSDLKLFPAPLEFDTGLPATQFATAAGSSLVALGVRDPAGIAARVLSISKEGIADVRGPAVSAGSLPIVSLAFRQEGKELFVVRQNSIELWDASADPSTVETIYQQGDSAERLTHARLSRDGAWLAAADSGGNIRVWKLDSMMEMPAPSQAAVEGFIKDLEFDPDGKWLTVVLEDPPLRRVRLADLSDGGTMALEEVSLQLAADALLKTAAPAGDDALAIATDSGVSLVNGFFSEGGTPNAAALPGITDDSVSLLKGGGEWLLAGTDGNPRLVLWNTKAPGGEGSEPALTAGSEEIESLRDAELSPDGRWAVVTAHDGTVQVAELSQSPLKLTEFHTFQNEYARFVGFTGDSRWLVAICIPAESGKENSRVVAWDLVRCRLAMRARDIAAGSVSGASD
jgi:hypothetical protein